MEDDHAPAARPPFSPSILPPVSSISEDIISFKLLANNTMGRSKNDVRSSLPVDHYRREIGKQDYKKSKSEIKDSKLKAQTKQTKTEVIKELFILMSFLIFVLGLVFVFLYMYLDKKEGPFIEKV